MRFKLSYLFLSVLLALTTLLDSGKIQAAPQKTGYKQIEAGAFFTAALKSDGTLSIWGYLEGIPRLKGYVESLGKKDWAYISAGLHFLTAIKKDGTMWSWGFNDAGQLGNGTTKNGQKPVQIGINKKWRMVSSNYAHSAAIATDGTLWTWGFNPFGGLGTGDIRNRSKPVQVGKDKDWSNVIAGEFHMIGVKKDGTTYGWGVNLEGTVGNGKTAGAQTTPVKIAKESWKSLTAGFDHTLALKPDGSLWGWGANFAGQIERGLAEKVLKITRIGKDNDWIDVMASGNDSYALKKDGTIWGWGQDFSGKPRQMGLDRDWSKISKHASGSQHVILQKKDGSLWGWGNNSSGQIIYGKSTEHLFDMSKIPMEVFPSAGPSKWASADIEKATLHGLINKHDLGFYKSDVTRTVATRQFIQLYKSLSGTDEIEQKKDAFTDYPSDDDVLSYQMGFIETKSKKQFKPYEPIKRQEFLLGIYRIMKASDLSLESLPTKWSKPYKDTNEVSANAKEALQYLDQAGLLISEHNQIKPNEAISREEASAYIWRTYNRFMANTKYSDAVKDLFYSKGYQIDVVNQSTSIGYKILDKGNEIVEITYFDAKKLDYVRNRSLPAKVTTLYTPGKDDYKLSLIAGIIEKDRNVSLPIFKESLLEQFSELEIDKLPYKKSTYEQYITVDGNEYLFILFNTSKTKERDLEVNY